MKLVSLQGGIYKGLKIKIPKNVNFRPTTNLVRESLFNILRSYTNCVFYDLFSGCGAVGLEAAGRNFSKIYSIENNYLLYKNLKKIVADKNIKNVYPLKMEVNKFLKKQLLDENNSLISSLYFFDPPYKLVHLYYQTLNLLEILAKKKNISIIIGETSKKNKVYNLISLKLWQQKIYGNTRLDFYLKNTNYEKSNLSG